MSIFIFAFLSPLRRHLLIDATRTPARRPMELLIYRILEKIFSYPPGLPQRPPPSFLRVAPISRGEIRKGTLKRINTTLPPCAARRTRDSCALESPHPLPWKSKYIAVTWRSRGGQDALAGRSVGVPGGLARPSRARVRKRADSLPPVNGRWS